MDGRYLNSFVLATALAFTGCATKKYVNNTTAPIKGQVDQVEAKVNAQGKTLEEQKQAIENQSTGLAATNERAVSADQRAGDALNRADQAGQKADTATAKADSANTKAETASAKSDRNAADIGQLRDVIANIDDYKPVKEIAVGFGFNRDTLTPEGKQKLDDLVADKSALKHYFIAVEGFTDKTGSAEYNAALSRRRADRVVQYLVAQHDIPIYRIHMVGLGAQKPAEEGRNREANAKNRRVEVTIYSVDQKVTAMNSPSANNLATPTR
jgi:outer membrane protein OmpA-like peptidoglycan-associated protein